MNRNRPANFGSPIYPSPTAGKGERIGQTPMVRCQHCGMPNNMNLTKVKDGESNVVVSEAGAAGADGLYSHPAVIEVKGGCRFCGSNRPTPQKPPKFPDPDKIPATGWKRDRR